MGLIKQGILGGFRKKTGTVIGAKWRGLDVIRALPRSNGKAPTAQQLEQQQKFGLVTAFLSDISDLIDIGYRSADSVTPMNRAVAYHIKQAIAGSYPDFTIDLSSVRYSIGKVQLPYSATAVALAGGKIKFAWDRLTEEDKFINPADTVTLVAYSAAREKFVKVVGATTRGIGEFEMQLPQVFDTDTVHLYISFSSATKKLNSDSMYIGTEVVSF